MRRAAGAVLLLLLCGSAPAIEQLVIELGSTRADGWQLERLQLEINLAEGGDSTLNVRVAALQFGTQRVEQVRLRCRTFELLASEVICRRGQLDFDSALVKARAVAADFRYRIDSGEVTLSLAGLPLAEGKAKLALHAVGGNWRVDAGLDGSAIAGVHALLASAGLELPALDYQGQLDATVVARGSDAGLQQLTWTLQTQAAGYSNAAGSQAGEALGLVSEGRAKPVGDDWQVSASLKAQQGMLYAEPLYLEFSERQTLALQAQLQWRAARGELQLASVTFAQPQVVNGSLRALLKPGGEILLPELELELHEAWLPGLYINWLQPWLAGGSLGKLETDGRLHGSLSIRNDQPQAVSLQLDRVTFREPGGLFGVRELDARLRWDRSDSRYLSTLAWQGANFHKLELGAAAVQLETAATDMQLLQPMIVPLLDGTLHVDQFELGIDTQGRLRWLLDGLLTPVSMEAFSAALGWPPLSGKLSGMVPKVRYEQGELTVGGVLLVQAFDGDITVRRLRVQQPLGLAPRLWADAQIKDLDLDTLTRTFSFGRIEGRFEGEVKDLYMEAWQPVAFDARFGTPVDDRSRHRISQKAVDNISNLGGAGMGGALSRSFLRFLEDFPYQRLGIRCRLADGVCAMGGIAPAGKGYYLVEGTVLPPRLDVVGYSDQVNWTSLIDRLVAATRGGTPTTR